jgi:hypothetical protein
MPGLVCQELFVGLPYVCRSWDSVCAAIGRSPRFAAVRFAGIVVGGWMAERNAAPVEGLGLADAIGLLRDDLLRARAAGADAGIQLPVESMTVELTVTATKSLDGKAAFTVPVVGLQLGGGGAEERGSEQKVTVVFGGPVDRTGNPVKVAQPSSERKG